MSVLGLGALVVAVLVWWPPSLALREDAFDKLIREAAKRHHVSPFLVKAVIRKESSFNPLACGDKGEIGLMQITDGAVKEWEKYTKRRCPLNGLLYDPRLNIEIGTWYLGRAMTVWREYRDGDVLALAAYNAGGSNARKWAPEDPRDGVPLKRIRFPSTREYIKRIRQDWRSYEREYNARK